jgi:probable F420-dependent oxidoreductase
MATTSDFGLDVGIYGRNVSAEAILDMARYADVLGFDSLWVADHVIFPAFGGAQHPYSKDRRFPVDPDSPILDPIMTMGVIGGATKRIKIGTAVLVMPMRNPVLVSRMLITLDQYTNGRVILGAGSGWLKEEFEALGFDNFDQRGKSLTENVEIFKAMCGGGIVSYKGETFSFEPIYSQPGSIQRPHPPVLIGGVADVALRRVARQGDGWISIPMTVDEQNERLASLKRICAAEGSDFSKLHLVYKIFFHIGISKRDKKGNRTPGIGTVAEVIDDLKTIVDQGFHKIMVRFPTGDSAAMRQHIDRLVNDIIPKV